MSEIRLPAPVKFFCGIIAANEEFLATARAELVALCGPADLESGVIPFDFTEYYREEMGPSLLRKFVAFAACGDPGGLADLKVKTNAIEVRLAASAGGAPRRPVNLDPGYVTPDKVVLATTKACAHRVYLGQGIHAEVTLNFRKKGCAFFEWTYPDYRTPAYAEFFLRVNAALRAR
jgi:hypothetical protein